MAPSANGKQSIDTHTQHRWGGGSMIIGRTGVAATASTQENAKRNRIVPVERERVGFEQPKAFK